MTRSTTRAVNTVPVLVALVLFVTAVMALMVFSSFRWDQISRQGLLPLDQLSESRRAATVAEVHLDLDHRAEMALGDHAVAAAQSPLSRRVLCHLAFHPSGRHRRARPIRVAGCARSPRR